MSIQIEELKNIDYKMKYFKECKYIWDNYIPQSGSASCLQGELLRAVEKLRYEAQNNGNGNWDEDFEYFCDFISYEVNRIDLFSAEEKETAAVITGFLRSCGRYADICLDESLSDEEVEQLTGSPFDVGKLAYVGDNLYDMLDDLAGKLHKLHPEPLAYEYSRELIR